MAFKLIDIDKWHRKEFYLHYIDNVVCSYSATVDLDITPLRGQRLYAAMLWMTVSYTHLTLPTILRV